jgi:anti-sigma factor RsiW
MATIRDCKKIQGLLSEYVDGALPTDQTWEVDLHIASCAVCAQAAQELSRTANLLRELPKWEPSVNFEAILAKRLADDALKPRPETWFSSLADIGGRFTKWWTLPSLRPALAVGIAAVVIGPFALILSRPANLNVSTIEGNRIPITRVTPKAASDTTSLDQLLREHSAYSSSETLGDPAALVSL